MTMREYAKENSITLPKRKDEDFKNTRVEDFFEFSKEFFIKKELSEVSENSLNFFDEVCFHREKLDIEGEFFKNEDSLTTMENRALEIEVPEKKRVVFTNFFNKKEDYTFKNYKITVNPSAQLDLFLFCKGGKNSINYLEITLLENAKVNLYALEDLRGDSLHSNIVKIKHQGKSSKSSQLFKYILDEKSQGVYSSSVVIEKEAIGADVSQLVKGLILSEEAESKLNTRPHLEIYVDDVKASHGSAIGALDEEALLYLKQRGLDDNQAEKILTDSFRKEILEFLPQSHREKVEKLL